MVRQASYRPLSNNFAIAARKDLRPSPAVFILQLSHTRWGRLAGACKTSPDLFRARRTKRKSANFCETFEAVSSNLAEFFELKPARGPKRAQRSGARLTTQLDIRS